MIRRKNAFTLIELLVVISIVAVLIAIMLPALSSAKHGARVMACAANLRQIGLAWQTYLMDNGFVFPVPPSNLNNWHLFYGGKHPSIHPANFPQARFLNPYVGHREKNAKGSEVFRCTEDRDIRFPDGSTHTDGYPTYEYYGNSYPANFYLLNMHLKSSDPRREYAVLVDAIEHNLAKMVLAGDFQWYYSVTDASWDAHFHNRHDQMNLLFLDGHVAYTQTIRGEAVTDSYIIPINFAADE